METEKSLVEMKNITKSFGAVQAVVDIDFSVTKGEIIGLVGDNGAGKSTLIKILSGALLPDKGDIYIEGKKVNIKNERDSINLGIETIYQDLAIFNNLDIKGNIFIGRENMVGGIFNTKFLKFFLNENEMEERSIKLLNNLKINFPSTGVLARNLSGGQRQAVAIARVLLFEAKLVIMDEPTSALAVKEVQKVLSQIIDLKRRGISVVIISHRIDDIFKVADKIIVMRRGRKVGEKHLRDTSQKEIESLIIGLEENINV